ncbi:Hsp70 family protein [Parafrankia discariae]|uniref:Hsp70 family protein n=1 Tax=Parafrankia discariae TaxID=365528 RepID=UPI00036939E1|nr:Hsp70 family protein [Parafrankia discariae]
MGYQLGIDVGSATTIVAATDGGWPAVLSLGGTRAVPSVLYMPQTGGVLFGRAAERRARTDPDRAARGFLRRLGEPGHLLVGGAAYSPDGLLARLVGHLVGQVVAARGEEPEQIVVAHPASWPAHRREVFASAVSHLSDVSVPVTTCAAADAIGTLLARRSGTRTVDLVGVYDFGAGHFDAAVLSFSPFGFQQLGTSVGVNHAGGADFDELLVERVLAEAGAGRERLDRADPAVGAALARLRAECAQAKEYLAEEDEIEVALELPGRPATSVVLRRADLETLVAPVVDDTVRAFRRTLRTGEATPEDLSSVLLYGGAARMPIVAAQMRAAFPAVTRWEYGSDDDIATGAALIAARLAAQASHEEVTSVIRPPDSSPPILSAPPLSSVPPLRSVPPAGLPPGAVASTGGRSAAGDGDTSSGLVPPGGAVFGGAAAGVSASSLGYTSWPDRTGQPPAADPDATAIGRHGGSADDTLISRGGPGTPPPTGAIPTGDPSGAGYQSGWGSSPYPYGDAAHTVAAGSSAGGDRTQAVATPGGSGTTEASAASGVTGVTGIAGGHDPRSAAPTPSQAGTFGGSSAGGSSAGTRAVPRGGLFGGWSRATIAAAVAAIVFVAAGTTLGIVLTGGGDDTPSNGIVPIAAPAATLSPPAATTAPPAAPTPGPNTVLVAGSSEVAPITETAYAGFRKVQQNVTVNVEASTTEDGFTKLCAGDIDIAGASFEFDPSFSKDPGCADQIVGFEVAHHTLPIVVNPQNTWARCMTLDQVRKVWDAGSTINRWNQIDSSFPDEPITFVGPSRNTVQAQVFNSTVNDSSSRSRPYQETDLSGVANDVAGDRLAMGFLDFPTFETFGPRLKGLEIDNGEGCVEPNAVTAGTGFYLPLCKPVFVYARKDSLQKPAAAAFMRYYMENGEKIAFDAHYVPRTKSTIDENVARVDELTKGVPAVPA